MTYKKLVSALLGGSLLVACSGNELKPNDYPEWVYSPTVEQGLAAADCVPIHNGNIALAMKQVTASGRMNIAQQIEVKVKAMDKTYDRVTTTNEGASTGGTFESVSKQVTQQTLSGVRAEKTERTVVDNKPYICSLVVLNPEATSGLIDDIMKASEANLSPNDKSVLKEQFLAYKAQEELEQAVQQN